MTSRAASRGVAGGRPRTWFVEARLTLVSLAVVGWARDSASSVDAGFAEEEAHAEDEAGAPAAGFGGEELAVVSSFDPRKRIELTQDQICPQEPRRAAVSTWRFS